MSESVSSERRANKIAKLDRIEVWRTEVLSSQKFCVCSAPASSQPSTAKRRTESARGDKDEAVTAAESASASSTAPEDSSESLFSRYKGQLRTKLLPRTKLERTTSNRSGASTESERSSRLAERDEGKDCPICSLPVDDVMYVSFSKDGSGIAWPGHLNSDNALPAEKQRSGKLKIFHSASKIFKVPRRAEKMAEPTSDKVKGATEMYSGLRPDTRGVGEGEGSVGSLMSSEDGRGKPALGLEEKAERLERAARLLKKSRPSSPGPSKP
ncbi:hypothetical protein F5Y15DRAFT_414138 [Xylariaceae sp. FL0016]|nr:hypothetical protein F5Y15DRAFT_414138 [Xylariaceae sp. FL0016]